MIKKSAKFMSIFLTMVLAASMLSGCNKEKVAEAVKEPAASSTSSYPIKTNVKLKYWVGIGANLASSYTNFGDSEAAKELTKKTGISVEYVHPPLGSETEQFNLMLASGDLPDIIQWDWYGIPGGPEKAITDGYIIKLNDVIDKYAPNLKKVYADNPDAAKLVKTDSGTQYVFPQLNIPEAVKLWQGPIVRKDLLDELKLEVPVTIDDWTAMLKAFKAKGLETPFTFANNTGVMGNAPIAGAFGVTDGLYVDNGKVKYGQMEPGYKDYLTLLNTWFKDGLLDKNLVNVDGKTMDADMLSGNVGATVGNLGGGLKKWIQALATKNSPIKLMGVPYPVLKKGDTFKFGQKDWPYVSSYSAAISAKSKNIELAARFLDYSYSKEGQLVNNMGVEGASYTMDSTGKPIYTDLITANPQKLTMAVALSKYARAGNGGGPYLPSMDYFNQYTSSLPEQKLAVKNWANSAEKTKMPMVSLTSDESAEAASIQTDIKTYSDEMFLKFMMGKEPIENFDKSVTQLKKMNVDKYISIYQVAYDRYAKRK